MGRSALPGLCGPLPLPAGGAEAGAARKDSHLRRFVCGGGPAREPGTAGRAARAAGWRRRSLSAPPRRPRGPRRGRRPSPPRPPPGPRASLPPCRRACALPPAWAARPRGTLTHMAGVLGAGAGGRRLRGVGEDTGTFARRRRRARREEGGLGGGAGLGGGGSSHSPQSASRPLRASGGGRRRGWPSDLPAPAA